MTPRKATGAGGGPKPGVLATQAGDGFTDAGTIRADPTTTNFNQLTGTLREPTDYDVSDSSLIRNQLSTLLNDSSPYLASARARAQTYAQERGLANSSLAATAGESAAIDAAMPIAQGDAQTFGRADEFNATNRSYFDRDYNNFAREGAMAMYEGVLAQEAQDKTLREQGRIADQDVALRRRLGLGELDLRRDLGEGDLALRRRLGLADVDLRRGDLALRGELGRGDLDVRRGDLALRGELGRGDLDVRREDLGLRGELGRGDLDIRRDTLALNEGDLELRRDTLEQQRIDSEQTQRTNITAQIQAIRQQALSARANLESNPNMSDGAKAAAIQALTAQASQDIRELIRISGIDLPAAWPDWINDFGPATPAPPPPPPPPRPGDPGYVPRPGDPGYNDPYTGGE